MKTLSGLDLCVYIYVHIDTVNLIAKLPKSFYCRTVIFFAQFEQLYKEYLKQTNKNILK